MRGSAWPANILAVPQQMGWSPMAVKVKRVYDKPGKDDGTRILVDRLWPRGLTKAGARADMWIKDIAPSDALRRWFAHDPARWPEFRKRYFMELKDNPQGLEPLRAKQREGTLTLLFGARDTEHNNGVALREFLTKRRR